MDDKYSINKIILEKTPHKIIHKRCDISKPKNLSYKNNRNYVNFNKLFNIDTMDIMLNPEFIFYLNDVDLEFDFSVIFNALLFQIGGTQIDKLDMNQINIYQKIYKLEIRKENNIVHFPIPFYSMIMGLYLNCKFQHIEMFIEFTNASVIECIEKIELGVDLVKFNLKPNWFILNYITIEHLKKKSYHNSSQSQTHILMKYFNCFNKPLAYNLVRYNTFTTKISEKISCLKEKIKYEENKIFMIKQNQYCVETLPCDVEYYSFKLHFNHTIKNLYLYFENIETNIIHKAQVFEQLFLSIEGHNIFQITWNDLVLSKSKLELNLPEGVYQINLKKYINISFSYFDNVKIELIGVNVPTSNIGMCVCAESYNYISHINGMYDIVLTN